MAAPQAKALPAEDLSERTFRMLADTIPHLVWSTRPDGQDDYFNRRLYEYTGLPPERLKGRGWFTIVHPDDLERCRAAWDRALAQGARYEVEYRLRRHDGVYRWHFGTAEPLRAGGRIVRWFGTSTDIEERKQAELQLEKTRGALEEMVAERTVRLRESEKRLREIIRNEPECVKLLDAQGRLLEMNSAGLRMIEAEDLAQVRGQPVYGMVAPEHRAAFRDLTERVCRGDRGTLEFEIVGLKGTRRRLETHAGPFRDEARGETVLLGITRDVTEQRRAEQAVRELMTQLVHTQEAERSKLAGDLHDLIGQKLTALGINLEFVRQRMPQAGATTIAARLHQMSNLLEETIGSIREVMADLRPQVLDEHGLSAALYQYASTFEARTGLRVQVKGAEGRVLIPHDVAIALFRIAQEALTNVVKHSGATQAVVRVRKSPHLVEIEVEDDGRGLKPAEALASGGWGLRMMRERAEAVGGRFRLEDAGPGTRVGVSVPLGHANQRHPG